MPMYLVDDLLCHLGATRPLPPQALPNTHMMSLDWYLSIDRILPCNDRHRPQCLHRS